jgi:hypothetical protein
MKSPRSQFSNTPWFPSTRSVLYHITPRQRQNLNLGIFFIPKLFLKITIPILTAKDKAEAIVTAFGLKAAWCSVAAVARRIPFVDTSMVAPQYHFTAFALVVRPIVVSFFISG